MSALVIFGIFLHVFGLFLEGAGYLVLPLWVEFCRYVVTRVDPRGGPSPSDGVAVDGEPYAIAFIDSETVC